MFLYLAEVSTEIVRGLNNTRNLWRFLLLKKKFLFYGKNCYITQPKKAGQ